MNEQIVKKLQKVTFFNGLDQVHIENICNKSKVLSFKKDSIIFCQGDEAHAFFLVISGWVSIVKESPGAEQSVLHVFKDGESFAEPAAIVIGRYPASAYAASTCELLEIKVSSLKKMIQDDPDVAMRMIARLSQQLNTLIIEFDQYKTMSVPRRLAIFLLEMLEDAEDKKSIDLPFNKTVLASHLGIQPGTLSRAFNQLEQYGVKTDRSGHIVFDDINRLQDYAENLI